MKRKESKLKYKVETLVHFQLSCDFLNAIFLAIYPIYIFQRLGNKSIQLLFLFKAT